MRKRQLIWFLLLAAAVACFERDGRGQSPIVGAGSASGGAGGGVTIGNAVSGGTNNYNLIVDGSGNVGQEATLGAARFPAMLGDVQNTAGSLTNTIQPASVTLAKMANLAANSFIGNNTGAGATPIALTIGQSKTLLAIACADLTNAAASCATDATNAGNISTGILALARGGMNAGLTASNGGIFYSTASAGAILGGTATANQALLSGSSTAPAWSTATYPATTTINQLLYSSAANTIAGLATANNAVLVTSAGGVPSVAAPSANLQVNGSVLDTIQGIQTTSTPQFARIGLGQAADGTALLAGTKNGIGTTSTVGFFIQNTAAAAAGAQQYSARVVDAIGQGWKTNATAASQPVEIYVQLEPIQGAANPGAELEVYGIQNNGTAQSFGGWCFPNAALASTSNFGLTIGADNTRCPDTGLYAINSSNMFGVFANTSEQENFTISGLGFNSGNRIYWGSGAISNNTTGDTGLCRQGVDLLELNDGSGTCTAATAKGVYALAGVLHEGTTFTASGCSNSTLVGGATGGSYNSGTTGTCTVVITMGNSATAPNGWACSASDTTTPADVQTMSASNTTTATITGTTVSGDVIKFHCDGY